MHPTPTLEDQVPVFMSPSDLVAQLYPQVLTNKFQRTSPITTDAASLFLGRVSLLCRMVNVPEKKQVTGN
jgi:hypothetical protein